MVYDRYQKHKAEQRTIASGSSPDPNYNRLSQDALPEHANGEVLEKLGIEPPSYDDVVVNRAIMPPEPHTMHVNEKHQEGLKVIDASDSDDSSDTSSVLSVSKAQEQTVQFPFADKWETTKARREARHERKMAKCQAKYERKCAKKAEKAAWRAERKARCSGCC